MEAMRLIQQPLELTCIAHKTWERENLTSALAFEIFRAKISYIIGSSY
jgi:hypothetical protein